MSLVVSSLEKCAEWTAYFGKMRRDKLYAFGVICIFGWLVVTYVLFTHQPPIRTKFTSSHRNKINHNSFSKLGRNIDQFSVSLKQQMQQSNKLLLDLKEIVEGERIGSEKEKQKKKKEEFEVVTEKQPAPENVVIPVLIFACNRVSVTKAIDPLLEYRGDDPARKAKFPIIVSQVRYNCVIT